METAAVLSDLLWNYNKDNRKQIDSLLENLLTKNPSSVKNVFLMLKKFCFLRAKNIPYYLDHIKHITKINILSIKNYPEIIAAFWRELSSQIPVTDEILYEEGTILHAIYNDSSKELFKLIFNQGLSFTKNDVFGLSCIDGIPDEMSILDIAALYGSKKCFDLINKSYPTFMNENVIFFAYIGGNDSIINQVIAEQNCEHNQEWMSMFHYGCPNPNEYSWESCLKFSNYTFLMKKIEKCGAYLFDTRSKTALFCSVEKEDILAVKYILKMNPDLDKACMNKTPIMRAIELDNYEIFTNMIMRAKKNNVKLLEFSLDYNKKYFHMILNTFDSDKYDSILADILFKLVDTDNFDCFKAYIASTPISRSINTFKVLWDLAAVCNDAKYFDEFKLDKNFQQNFKRYSTPLLNMAITRKNKVAIQFFIESGANLYDEVPVDPNFIGVHSNIANRGDVQPNYSPISMILDSDDLDFYKFMISLGWDVNKCLFGPGKITPLMEAVFIKNPKAIKPLMQLGADPKLMNNRNSTALLIAIIVRNYECIEELCKNGADPNQESPMGVEQPDLYLRPLERSYIDERTATILMKYGAKVRHLTSFLNNLEMMKFLVSKGADINAMHENYCSPILIAAKFHSVDVLKTIINLGADVNIKNCCGTTPLLMAINHNRIENAKYLLSKGADINAMQNDGMTPLFAAIKNANSDTAEFLINSGANVNHIGYLSSTAVFPLQISIYDDDQKIARMLIERGVQLNVNVASTLIFAENHQVLKWPDYETPMILYAIKFNRYNIVKIMLEHGADVNCRSNNGATPLFAAIVLQLKNIFDLLFNFKLNVNDRFHCIKEFEKKSPTSQPVSSFDGKMKTFYHNYDTPKNLPREDETPFQYSQRMNYTYYTNKLLEHGAK